MSGMPDPQMSPPPSTGGAPAPLPTMPAALGAPVRAPSMRPPPLAAGVTPDTPDEHLPQPPKLDQLKNLYERRGLLLADAVEDQGKRISEAMQQPPTNAVKLSPEQIRDYWRFSPNGMDEATNNQRFWEIHDQVLAQTGDASMAELQAMQQVYPYRSALIGQGIASIERQVQTAEHVRGVFDGSVKPPSEVVAQK